MRHARFLAPWRDDPEGPSAIYHCVSRVVDRRHAFGAAEKEHFIRLMRIYEEFCGVRILDYCIMSNHFHLEVEVLPRPAEGLSEEELLRRLRLIKREGKVAEVQRLLAQRREAGDEAGVAEIMERHLYRMWNLSEFMKTLLQRFTRWFNKKHKRKGTLWEERFKSVLVEDGYAARVVAAYIDLNPVRAGMVKSPEHYRWCGYGEAVAGGKRARAGIARVMEKFERLGGEIRGERSWRSVAAEYRTILYQDGKEKVRENPATGKLEVVRRGMSPTEVQEVLAEGGHLALGTVLRCRVRALVDGAVIGVRGFVDEVYAAERWRFGPNRKEGARPIHGSSIPLCSLRAAG